MVKQRRQWSNNLVAKAERKIAINPGLEDRLTAGMVGNN
jgi:hypothetical protein